MIYQRFLIGLLLDRKNRRKEFTMKYVDAVVTYDEVPDEIALCLNISGCTRNCKGCHSDYLKEDIGEELNTKVLNTLIRKHKGITCVCIMGGDCTPEDIVQVSQLLGWVKSEKKLKTCWYTGMNVFPVKMDLHNTDYIKLGPYKENLGPLSSRYTNQKFLKLTWGEGGKGLNVENLNYKFRKNENEN